MPSSCKSVPFSQDSFPTVYTRDATGACTVSSQCKLYKCGDDSSPYGYQQYAGIKTCSVDPNSPGCGSIADHMVQCFVNDCTCGGTSPCTNVLSNPYVSYPSSPFTYPIGPLPWIPPALPAQCPTSHRQVCTKQDFPTPFCAPVRPGYQTAFDPPGLCYVGDDPCNLLLSGTDLTPTSPQCLAACCRGSTTVASPLPYLYFDPRYPVIQPWWLNG